ncbi:MAG: hypothetical protein A2X86_21785 [Bdellovibrionales bacterium GWA2_49_15]|nr:MAG: hypothetical protein A2X86_21785 [Bdellovibrionales bacterium GWA2_49_15]HAZ12846.1 hypothetical protein [Bdellovibrionales bacterium]
MPARATRPDEISRGWASQGSEKVQLGVNPSEEWSGPFHFWSKTSEAKHFIFLKDSACEVPVVGFLQK